MLFKQLFGFQGFKDLAHSVFGGRNPYEFMAASIFASLAFVGTFITKYVYDDEAAIYLLVFMVGVDFVTGVLASRKSGDFSSKKAPRAFVILFMYAVLISISWNMAAKSTVWGFLPSLLYGGFTGVTFFSIIENFYKLEYLNPKIARIILNKVNEVTAEKEPKKPKEDGK